MTSAVRAGAGRAVERAFGWFREVEACCTRFDAGERGDAVDGPGGVPVPVSDILFEAVRFAVAVAEATGGAFDPTVGATRWRRAASTASIAPGERPHDAGAAGR